ncbi:IclR family transcriptional regulator [Rouxiella badensis]|uniref:IclR family transcriptional regulator n=1 Tax=Rouxiella badensis TaxID=1646377 RepID=UPI001D14CB22|nr:IclR family transcriptional regulator [Rouxiella badensis]MCC3733397.1 IclR family transcriptional regulator [Rouxiella badensis]MCC3757952.1 IclR family transcriptional regulator [Rouxiella badensis]
MSHKTADEERSGKEKPLGSQSLFRGLQLIEILGNFPNGCPLAHLAELADMNKSTVHRLLQGLHASGYVTPAPSPGSYRLTTKLISIGQKALTSLNIIHVAAPHLEQLNLKTGETVNFSTREDDHVLLIYKLEPTTGMMRTRAYIGQHMPLYCSAMGKIFMAYEQSQFTDHYWQTHQDEIQVLTRNTLTELSKMQEELADIRQFKRAMDREENELGVSCIAAPVFDLHQQVKYSVSVSLPTAKLKQVGTKALTEAVQDIAQRVSKEIGFVTPQ